MLKSILDLIFKIGTKLLIAFKMQKRTVDI